MPFTAEQFFGVFRAYNVAVWPAQAILVALALTALFLATRRPAGGGEGVWLVLAALWLWAGLVYHVGFFRAVNPAAGLFGAAFAAQGLLFGWKAFRRPGSFRARRSGRGAAGTALVAYALLVYPLLGAWAGHGWPDGPTFGVPCPVTIFTFGVLLWSEEPVPRRLLWIPAAWSLVGGWAALGLGVPEDFALPLAAALAGWWLVREGPGRERALSGSRGGGIAPAR